MGNESPLIVFFIFIMFVLVIAVFVTLTNIKYKDGYKNGYKEGQIDAILGKVKFEIVSQPDKTSIWREKK